MKFKLIAMKKIMSQLQTFSVMALLCNTSCSIKPITIPERVLISKSEVDQSSIFDSNGDGKPDVERWYRGSNIAYEKLDLDYDGYWDYQGRRNSGGSFDIYIKYPTKKYSVISHHVFYATEFHSVDVIILARP